MLVMSLYREEMLTSTALNALRGLVQLITSYQEPGTKATNTLILLSRQIAGRVEMSRSGAEVGGGSSTTLNSTSSIALPVNVTA